MDIEDIKIGTELIAKSKIVEVDGDNVIIQFTAPLKFRFSTEMFNLLDAQPCPKHDPCRRFKKGDIVRLREYNGRKPYDYWHKQVIKNFGAKLDTVLEDEHDSGNVDIFQDAPIDELTVRVNSCHLKLVTPVEELEPYKCGEGIDAQLIFFQDERFAEFENEEDAQRVCAWLNSEYRKEQK